MEYKHKKWHQIGCNSKTRNNWKTFRENGRNRWFQLCFNFSWQQFNCSSKFCSFWNSFHVYLTGSAFWWNTASASPQAEHLDKWSECDWVRHCLQQLENVWTWKMNDNQVSAHKKKDEKPQLFFSIRLSRCSRHIQFFWWTTVAHCTHGDQFMWMAFFVKFAADDLSRVAQTRAICQRRKCNRDKGCTTEDNI